MSGETLWQKQTTGTLTSERTRKTNLNQYTFGREGEIQWVKSTWEIYRFIKLGVLVSFFAKHFTWRDLHLLQFSHLKRRRREWVNVFIVWETEEEDETSLRGNMWSTSCSCFFLAASSFFFFFSSSIWERRKQKVTDTRFIRNEQRRRTQSSFTGVQFL